MIFRVLVAPAPGIRIQVRQQFDLMEDQGCLKSRVASNVDWPVGIEKG